MQMLRSKFTSGGQQPTSAATEQTRWAKDLELRPTNTPSDVLRLTPGLIIGQHHGGGKGDQILFRGFDSDHGTDFAVFVDGIPVNIVSHAHGQGYADLHWLIPETIDRVEIYKGPYFAHLGDFATSGAMNIVTKRRDKSSSFSIASYPPMALRMGVEGDVTLRIEIDSDGKVTKADIVKSGGAAFDEEAVKAVKQARFEPANKDGRNVPA